jgi:glycosyltransferase involved in cell wall biosynthesis
MRIVLTNFHPRRSGGHFTYITTLLKLQESFSEYKIAVAVPKSSDIYESLQERGYPLLFECDFPSKIQKEPLAIVKSIRRFREILEEFKPDIIHTNGGADLFIVVWSTIFKSDQYHIVRTHHSTKAIPKELYHRWIYQKRVVKNVYVSNSSFLLSLKLGSLQPKGVAIIPNGVDTDFFSPMPKDRELLDRFNIPEDSFCFGSCAGTADYKRVDIIIKASKILKERVKLKRTFRVLVIGEESAGRRAESLAKELGVEEFIFCGYQSDVRDFISIFDVGFILSDRIETISYASREMLSMGKPLISSSYSGLKENIIDGENGILVKPNSVEETYEAMRFFLELKKDKYREFAKKARGFAKKRFGVRRQIDKHHTLYKNILEADKMVLEILSKHM